MVTMEPETRSVDPAEVEATLHQLKDELVCLLLQRASRTEVRLVEDRIRQLWEIQEAFYENGVEAHVLERPPCE